MATKALKKVDSFYTAPTETKYIYELCQGTKLTIQIIKNNVIGIKGKGVTKKRSTMRYSPYAESIWKSEQHPDSVMQLEPIVIEGEKVVPVTNELLVEFLDAHPNNEANGGSVFRKRNIEAIADDQTEKDDFITRVRYRIMESASEPSKQESLRAVGRTMGYTKEAKNPDLKYLKARLGQFMDEDPYNHARRIHDMFDDPISKAISDIKLAVDMKELAYSSNNGNVKWTGNSEIITVIPAGKDWEKEFAAFILSPEGFDYKKELDSIVASRK